MTTFENSKLEMTGDVWLLRRIGNIFTVVLILIAIVAPTGWLLLRPSSDVNSEQRLLAELPRLPGLHRREIVAYPGKFEAYFNDHFGFRKELVHTYRLVQLKLLGTAPAELARRQTDDKTRAALQATKSRVLPGKDGWLFYTGDDALESYRGALPFRKREIQHWRDTLQARRDWLAARGIEYLVVVAPNKHSVYGEFIPRTVNIVSDVQRLDQLKSSIHESKAVELIDLTPSMQQAKSAGRLFHRTDTHWNELGAFAAFQTIQTKLLQNFPEIEPWSLADFRVVERRGEGGDLAKMLTLTDVLQEDWVSLIPQRPRRAQFLPTREGQIPKQLDHGLEATKQSSGNRPRAVVIHDSYMVALEPFLSECFSHVAYHWRNVDFPADVIERERPDIVIQEFVERSLMLALPTNPAGMMAAPIAWKNDRATRR